MMLAGIGNCSNTFACTVASVSVVSFITLISFALYGTIKKWNQQNVVIHNRIANWAEQQYNQDGYFVCSVLILFRGFEVPPQSVCS